MHLKKIKNKKYAFSLVELIVVSSILIIISSSGMIYFTDFIDDLAFNKMIIKVWDDFKDLDKKIDRKEIFDYELYLSGWINYYISSENIFDLKTSIKFNNLNSWIWYLSFSWSNSWTGVIKYYSNYKFKKEEIINWTWTFTWSFDNPTNYKIEWSFSWEILNTMYFNYFEKNKYIKLLSIHDGSNYLNSIVIKNILWKKTFWNNNSLDKITLTFEDNLWKTKTLEIKK